VGSRTNDFPWPGHPDSVPEIHTVSLNVMTTLSRRKKMSVAQQKKATLKWESE